MRYCSTKWELNRAQTIVLVGHGLGGLVIKSLIESFHFHEPAQKEQKARWEAFQQNIKGIVFYSVPHTTSQEEFVHYCESYTKMIENLDKDFKYFKGDMVFLNTEFESTIYQKDINLFAFVEGQKVQSYGYLSSFGGFSSLGQNICLLIVAQSWNLRDMIL